MAFAQSLLNQLNNNSKHLNDQVAGSSATLKFLDDGEYDVKVVAVDTSKASKNQLKVTYECVEGQHKGREYNDYIFIEDKDRKTGAEGLNWKFAKTLGMLIPDDGARAALFKAMSDYGEPAMDIFVGMRGRVVLETKQGYSRAKKVGNLFEVYDCADGTCVGAGATIDDAVAQAEATGLKRGFPKASSYIETHAIENLAKFWQDLPPLAQAGRTAATFRGTSPIKVAKVA